MGQFIDLTNRKFGRLLVLGPQIRRRKLIHWLCRCDCGVEKWICGQTLRIGSTKSCGCFQRELIGKRSLKDISGQRFGRLVVLNQHKIRGKSGIWLCRCDCGNKKWIRPTALKTGETQSCGCYAKEMSRKGILEKKKKYKVVLTTEQRRELETQIKECILSSEENIRIQILLLADQSPSASSLTDEEIAARLRISKDKAYYTRTTFCDPNFKKRQIEYARERLKRPHARFLRLQSLRRYEQKPETKELQKRYRQNLPAEVRIRRNEKIKTYRKTLEGKAKRKLERLQRTEWFRTPEGRAKKREYHQKYKVRSNRRYSERYQTDPQFRIRRTLTGRLRSAVKMHGAKKSSSVVALIGCSIQELVTILENKFKPGMTWGNYGSWHIDHIFPCSRFDLTQIEEQKKCFHHSNLQPLWAVENIVKSNKVVSVST